MTNSQPNTPFIRPGQSHETEVSSVTDNTQKSYERHIQAIENEIESESKTSTGKNRKRPKKAIIATACILLVAIAVPTVMYFLQVGPFTPKLSEKEQEYVGTWKASYIKENGKTVDIQKSDINANLTLNDDRSYSLIINGSKDTGKWTADASALTLVDKNNNEYIYSIENGRVAIISGNSSTYYFDPPDWSNDKSQYVGRWKVSKRENSITGITDYPNDLYFDIRGSNFCDLTDDEEVYLSGTWAETGSGLTITVSWREDGKLQSNDFYAVLKGNNLELEVNDVFYTIPVGE